MQGSLSAYSMNVFGEADSREYLDKNYLQDESNNGVGYSTLFRRDWMLDVHQPSRDRPVAVV
jgi:hypothetical protein